MKSWGYFLLFLLSCLAGGGCEKDEIKSSGALKSLYKVYQNGEISECRLDGVLVYTASFNLYDSPTVVYNQEGKEIASCNYGWGAVDPECEQLSACEVIYRVEDHISGEPAIDKYGLN